MALHMHINVDPGAVVLAMNMSNTASRRDTVNDINILADPDSMIYDRLHQHIASWVREMVQDLHSPHLKCQSSQDPS